MRHRQEGMTFIGLLFILVLAGLLVYAGIRLTPVYLNYMKIARSMDSVATEFKGGNVDVAGIRRSLERHWIVEDIDRVDYNDIEIQKDDSGISMHVAYEDKVPYMGNISLEVSFDKTVKIQ